MSTHNYTEPVSKLVEIGDPEHKWPDYPAQYGLTSTDIPELIRLVADADLRWAEPADALPTEEVWTEWYAQIHAWRALAQLKAEAAIPALVGIFGQIDEYDDDWWGEESMEVFPLIGPAAIEPLGAYLLDQSNPTWGRVAASGSLEKMAEVHPDFRSACMEAIVQALKIHTGNNETVNGSLLADLVELKAIEHLDVIKEVFESGNVDTDIDGDFEDAEIVLGLRQERSTPRKPTALQLMMQENLRAFQNSRTDDLDLPISLNENEKKRIKEKEKKAKEKRKQEKKTRKKNKKR